jgi:hypothetical protein
MKKLSVILLSVCVLFFAACEATKSGDTDETSNSTNSESKTPPTTKVKDGFVVSEDGTAKETPESGKANIQGKVLYNEKPAANVEVKLCEKFSTFSGCSGEEYKTKTDDNGEYLLKNVDPKVYDGLLAKVFETRMYIFAARSFGISSAKYKIDADTTFFAPPTNLFKSDMKVENLKANAKIEINGYEIKWDKYEDAAYYKFGLYADEASVISPYINEKVEAESIKIEKPMEPGKYRFKLEAYNANDIKLSQLKEDIEFTITGSSEPKEGEKEESKSDPE